MELGGRPLFDNPSDAALFVPRPEAPRLQRNCAEGINTLVLGEPGSGKTSLLRNVFLRLREEDVDAVVVDAGPAETLLDLLALVEDRLRGQGPPGAPGPPPSSESDAVLTAIRRLRRYENSDQRVVIMVDLMPGALDVHALFGRFRDELWQLPYTWAVVAPAAMRQALRTPPADAFFDDVIELGPLSRVQQEELIRLRLDQGEEPPGGPLLAGGVGNPRRLLQIVRESVRSGQPIDAHLEARLSRHDEVAALGPSAVAVYADLEENGPASASDEEFLARLGWSRQRAAKVLADLEAADLIRPETRPGPNGRPRKAFALVPPMP